MLSSTTVGRRAHQALETPLAVSGKMGLLTIMLPGYNGVAELDHGTRKQTIAGQEGCRFPGNRTLSRTPPGGYIYKYTDASYPHQRWQSGAAAGIAVGIIDRLIVSKATCQFGGAVPSVPSNIAMYTVVERGNVCPKLPILLQRYSTGRQQGQDLMTSARTGQRRHFPVVSPQQSSSRPY